MLTRRRLAALASVSALIAVASCTPPGEESRTETFPAPTEFGALPDGRIAKLWELRNESGAGVRVTDLGAIIVSLDVPDRDGALADVVLGFDTPAPYLTDSPYFGAVVGRYANRIANGRFTLDGKSYTLAVNNGPNHLHGGLVGFDKRLWTGQRIESAEGQAVRFTLRSEDGDEGYPGALDVAVTYTFTPANELIVDYAATAEAPTVVNLSQHSYFNLAGHAAGSVLEHELDIDADAFTPVDATLIPTGEIKPVAGTPFDFRTAKPIGRDIQTTGDEQLRFGGGYDHNFVLSGAAGENGLRRAAELTHPGSGRRMSVFTDQPGLQFYSGNFLDGSVVGKDAATYQHRGAICLETQHFPDSPNQPTFPSTRLDAGETFTSRTVFRFTTTGR